MRQIFLDTETTGLSAQNGDRIIEIGCIEMVARKLTGNNIHFYLNPDRDSHEEALRIHGIRNEFLRDKPRFPEVADHLLDYLKDAEIVIHNAAFDTGFLNNELGLAKKKPLHEYVLGVVDTLALAKELFPGKRNSLDALCDRFGIDNSNRTLHGALLDAELLAQVYINLTRGQNSFSMEIDGNKSENYAVEKVDFKNFNLPLVLANELELLGHEDLLKTIDAASQGKTVWRKL